MKVYKDGVSCVPVVARNTNQLAVLPVDWLAISAGMTGGLFGWHFTEKGERGETLITLWVHEWGSEGSEDECVDQVVERYLESAASSDSTVSEIRKRVVQRTKRLADYIVDRQPSKAPLVRLD